MSLVVGVCGAKRVGKDTFSKKVVEFNSDFKILHYAEDLKNFCAEIFNIPVNYFHDENLKDSDLPAPILMDDYLEKMQDVLKLNVLPRACFVSSFRGLLQKFGTEYVRAVQDNYWVARVENKIYGDTRPVLVSDTRFLNEASSLKLFPSSLIIRITRPDIIVDMSHASESESLQIPEDFIINSKKDDYSKIERMAWEVAHKLNR